MKFKCGLTPQEAHIKVEYYRNWHPFFTILPREVAFGDCRCLEWIERSIPGAEVWNGHIVDTDFPREYRARAN